ncbi:YihY/virulence factor BrkB family protein [Parasphingorhabdus litoris]|uniref:YihY/virulence factor BrkB family protein n=1 Tax=Parasphingorhabdus litoris TaxID=394733 RepID=UPI001E48BE11|nr:YihY/virulence factor BrkB family protein [Parasphingorhabdus litoris]
MSDSSPLSPEARREEPSRPGRKTERAARTLAEGHLPRRIISVIERTAVGVYTDGFTFAGNFAYLALLAVFSFFIVAAAIAGSIGQTAIGIDFVEAFLRTVPPSVASALHDPIQDAMGARTGPLLWFSAAVGLWTTASLIETIREILHRAYGVTAQRAFWEYRLTSIGLIILSVFFAMLALSAQFVVAGISEFLGGYFPDLEESTTWFSLSNVLPFLILFITLYLLFRLLTPRQYRPRAYPKWPGAVFISGWWLLITGFLPLFLKYAANYQLTYGSLAGVMITLIFFYLIGLGMVIGSELNAALADRPQEEESEA